MSISVPAHKQNKRPKLLYLALCDPDLSVTGVTVRMGAFVKQLSKYYDITLVNMTGSGHDAPPLPAGSAIDQVVDCRIQVPFSQVGYFLFSPRLYGAADSLLGAGNYDYLAADYGFAAIYGMRLAKKYKLPLLYFSSNVEYQMYWELGRHDPRRLLLAPYMYWAERAVCKAAYKVVTVSERDRQVFAQWTDPDKIIALPQGFDPEEMNPFYLPPPTDEKVVLFTGSLRDENNRQAARYIANVLAPQVTEVMPEVTFQIVGSAPPDDIAGANVDCLGFVEDINPIIQRANVVIAPMTYGHGISTKVVMGLAYGKPVLTTPQVAGGMPRRYSQMQVAPLASFASQLIVMLQALPPSSEFSSSHNFDQLCQDLAWPDLIENLHRQIEGKAEPPDSISTVQEEAVYSGSAAYSTQRNR